MVIKKAFIIIRYAVPAAIAKLATFADVDEKKETLRSYGLVLWNTDTLLWTQSIPSIIPRK